MTRCAPKNLKQPSTKGSGMANDLLPSPAPWRPMRSAALRWRRGRRGRSMPAFAIALPHLAQQHLQATGKPLHKGARQRFGVPAANVTPWINVSGLMRKGTSNPHHPRHRCQRMKICAMDACASRNQRLGVAPNPLFLLRWKRQKAAEITAKGTYPPPAARPTQTPPC